GTADHGGARHLGEGADVRQAGRAIAGLEQHMALGRRRSPIALDQTPRLLERPGGARFGQRAKLRRHRSKLGVALHRVNPSASVRNLEDTMTEALRFELKGNVAWLTMNRPQALNALNCQMALELMHAAIRCDEDPAVRCVVLTGSGKGFCAGGD